MLVAIVSSNRGSFSFAGTLVDCFAITLSAGISLHMAGWVTKQAVAEGLAVIAIGAMLLSGVRLAKSVQPPKNEGDKVSSRLKLVLLIAVVLAVIAIAAAFLNQGIHNYPFSVVIILGAGAAVLASYLAIWDPYGWKTARPTGRSPF